MWSRKQNNKLTARVPQQIRRWSCCFTLCRGRPWALSGTALSLCVCFNWVMDSGSCLSTVTGILQLCSELRWLLTQQAQWSTTLAGHFIFIQNKLQWDVSVPCQESSRSTTNLLKAINSIISQLCLIIAIKLFDIHTIDIFYKHVFTEDCYAAHHLTIW